MGDRALRGMYHVLEPLAFRRVTAFPTKQLVFTLPLATRHTTRALMEEVAATAIKAYQHDLKEMAPSVDSLHARDTPIQWIAQILAEEARWPTVASCAKRAG